MIRGEIGTFIRSPIEVYSLPCRLFRLYSPSRSQVAASRAGCSDLHENIDVSTSTTEQMRRMNIEVSFFHCFIDSIQNDARQSSRE